MTRHSPRSQTAGTEATPLTERIDRRAAKREHYLESAAGAVRTSGAGISMEEIAAACGVTKPILYRHFGDRNGLISALAEKFADRIFAELSGALSADVEPRQLVESTIDAYLSLIESDTEIYRFVTQTGPAGKRAVLTTTVGDFQYRVGQQVALVLGEQMRAAAMDSGPAEPFAQGIVGMVHAAGDWWLERRTMPRARLVSYLTDLLWVGLTGIAVEYEQRTATASPEPLDTLQHESASITAFPTSRTGEHNG